MAPALDATKYIYQGIWVNYSRGSIWGSTLTVSPQQASILSPALAILVSVAGAQLWTLSQYVLHQIYATSKPRTFIHHQSQAILRNSSSDFDALSRLSRLAIAWRHQRPRRLFRSLAPLLAWAALHFLLVVSAGVFSSVLLAGNSDVLSRSPWCGSFSDTYLESVYNPNQQYGDNIVAPSNEYNTYANSRIALVQQTVDVCKDRPDSCDGPRPKALPFTTTFVPGACPVNSSICHPDAGGSIALDTGFLSSHAHLGYNAPANDRISVRLTAQCSPLKAQDYVTSWQNISTSSASSSRSLCDARYGTSDTSTRNATATITKQELTCDETLLRPPYLLLPQEFLPGTDGEAVSSTFTPIDELYPSHADLSLVMLAFQSVYGNPVTDPWFSAQELASPSKASCAYNNVSMYNREHPLTAIACTQQWQICNTEHPGDNHPERCTTPASFYQTLDQIDPTPPKLVLTPHQLAIAQRIFLSAQQSSVYYFVWALSQSTLVPLKARDVYRGSPGATIPPDQWQTEMKYWMELLVATFQQTNLDYSTGQFAASTAYINVTTREENSRDDAIEGQNWWLCQNQIIHNSDFRNFNFCALLLTIVICTIIIVLGLTIEDITGCVRARKLHSCEADNKDENGKKDLSKQDMWIASSDLDMLRRIDELKNGTSWTLHQNGVPVTHVSHTVSANDLMTSRHTVEKGVGVVVSPSAAGKSMLAFDNAIPPYKRCMTCSTLEVSSCDSSSDVSQRGVSRGTDREGRSQFGFNPYLPT